MATANFDNDYVEEDSDQEAASSSEDEIDSWLQGTAQQRRHIRRRSCGGLSDSSEDDFEKEMNNELNDIVKAKVAAETQGLALVIGGALPTGKSAVTQGNGEQATVRYYDDVYFDSDSEGEYDEQGPSTAATVAIGPVPPSTDPAVLSKRAVRRKRHLVPSNDDLFYDPNMDMEDQQWVDRRRHSYKVKAGKGSPALLQPDGHRRAAAAAQTTDAVLNCPACMATLCLDCQRHATYQSQYRAMFVMNCKVNHAEVLRFPRQAERKSGKKKRSIEENHMPLADDSAKRESEGNSVETSQTTPTFATSNRQEVFHPVRCERCSTHVAMFDTDEVYHFFNIIASHA